MKKTKKSSKKISKKVIRKISGGGEVVDWFPTKCSTGTAVT